MNKTKTGIFIVMGVSGCGKSTVGKQLAKELKVPFFDGDDYHSRSNVDKMSKGNPLTDQDRTGWLRTLNKLAKEYLTEGAVIGCSALKQRYRDLLSNSIENETVIVYLEGTYEEIYHRMQKRSDHFMPAELLKSQFEALEPPQESIKVSITQSPNQIVSAILKTIKKNKGTPFH